MMLRTRQVFGEHPTRVLLPTALSIVPATMSATVGLLFDAFFRERRVPYCTFVLGRAAATFSRSAPVGAGVATAMRK